MKKYLFDLWYLRILDYSKMNQNAKGNYINNYEIRMMRNETRINFFLNVQKMKVHQKYPKIFKFIKKFQDYQSTN